MSTDANKVSKISEEDSTETSLKSSKSTRDDQEVRIKKGSMIKSKSASRVVKHLKTSTLQRKQSQRKLKQQIEAEAEQKQVESVVVKEEEQETPPLSHARAKKVDEILTNYKCSNKIEYLKSSSTPVVRRGPLKVPKGVSGLDISNIS